MGNYFTSLKSLKIIEKEPVTKYEYVICILCNKNFTSKITEHKCVIRQSNENIKF